MNIEEAAQILNEALADEQPPKITSTWINNATPAVYRYVQKNVRTGLGDIDWDRVVCRLDRDFQKRWVHRRLKKVRAYRNIQEVRRVLKPFKEKLYVFIAPADDQDRLLRDPITVALVRVAQRGNIRAQQEVAALLKFVVDQWIEQSPRVRKWDGYTDGIEEKIKACIRCYRFTGTFLGYLFRTLELSGRGIPRLQAYSLDETIGHDSEKRRADNVVQDVETGEIRMFQRS